MATASVSGLASGIDTAAMIDQLMQLEATSQNRLKSRVTSEQSAVTALQNLNSKLAALATSAKALATTSRDSGAWGTLSTTSSLNTITATAGNTASAGSFSVEVEALATSASTSLTGVAVAGNATFTIRDANGDPMLDSDGNAITLTTDADPSYGEIATKINATSTKTGLTARVINGDAGPVLEITSTKTGTDSNFSITDGTQTLTAANGADGRISVNGIQISSESNTYTDALTGVSVTVGAGTAVGATAQVTVARDAASRSASVKSMVDSVNELLNSIAAQTANNPSDPTKSGVLVGDGTVRRISDELLDTVYPGDETSLAKYGVELDRYGKFTFDAETFAKAYAADPDGVTKAFTGEGGFAERVQKVAEKASDRFDGTITTSIQGRNSTITRLNSSIDAWDDRLALRRATLERQFLSMETTLSNLQAQGNWLVSQLAGLSNNSNA